jgi:hypothetical protein
MTMKDFGSASDKFNGRASEFLCPKFHFRRDNVLVLMMLKFQIARLKFSFCAQLVQNIRDYPDSLSSIVDRDVETPSTMLGRFGSAWPRP